MIEQLLNYVPKRIRPVPLPPVVEVPPPAAPVVIEDPEPKLMPPPPSVFKQTPWKCGLFEFPQENRTRWFNPSLCSWSGATWLAVRRAFGDPQPLGQNSIEVFNLSDLRSKQVVNRQPLRFIKTHYQEHFEDPRLRVLGGEMFLSCTNFKIQNYHAHQLLVKLSNTGSHPEVAHIIYGRNGHTMDANTGNEKNWVWFDHPNGWHFVYEPWPHHVVRTALGEPKEAYILPESKCPWRYGTMRGGTPPFLRNGLYWTFFHSSLNGDQSKGEPRRRYYMGAYAFEAEPPFRITAITKEPLLIGSEEDGGTLPVVFPGGATFVDGEWLVVFGVNDCASGYIEIPHMDLSERMITL